MSTKLVKYKAGEVVEDEFGNRFRMLMDHARLEPDPILTEKEMLWRAVEANPDDRSAVNALLDWLMEFTSERELLGVKLDLAFDWMRRRELSGRNARGEPLLQPVRSNRQAEEAENKRRARYGRPLLREYR